MIYFFWRVELFLSLFGVFKPHSASSVGMNPNMMIPFSGSPPGGDRLLDFLDLCKHLRVDQGQDFAPPIFYPHLGPPPWSSPLRPPPRVPPPALTFASSSQALTFARNERRKKQRQKRRQTAGRSASRSPQRHSRSPRATHSHPPRAHTSRAARSRSPHTSRAARSRPHTSRAARSPPHTSRAARSRSPHTSRADSSHSQRSRASHTSRAARYRSSPISVSQVSTRASPASCPAASAQYHSPEEEPTYSPSPTRVSTFSSLPPLPSTLNVPSLSKALVSPLRLPLVESSRPGEDTEPEIEGLSLFLCWFIACNREVFYLQ